ncbi:MAG: antirestriction protein ArdA [bacterium]
MTTIETKPSIFLTDYASYNNGTQFQFGHWVDLTQFNDADELMEYIRNHFEEADKESPLDEFGSKREEIMITDFEGFPEVLYSESMSEKDFQSIYDLIEYLDQNSIESLENEGDNLLSLWNDYCMENNPDNQIHYFDDEFFNIYLTDNPMEAFRLGCFSNINWSDDYLIFNGYGNLKSINDPSDEIDETVLIDWILETQI